MSGFTATADPAYEKDFTVTSVWVQDPWYPRVSSIWGRSRPPNSKVSAMALGQDYLPYDRPHRRHPGRDGMFMLVLPQLPPGTRVAQRGRRGLSQRSYGTQSSETSARSLGRHPWSESITDIAIASRSPSSAGGWPSSISWRDVMPSRAIDR